MDFKPAKSRSLALVRGKIRRDVFFDVAEQRIPTVSEEPVKSLGRVFDESLTDKSMRGAILPSNHRGTANDRGGTASREFQIAVAPVRSPSKTALAVNHL